MSSVVLSFNCWSSWLLGDGGSFDVLAEERERAAVRERLTLGVVSCRLHVMYVRI